MKIKPYWAIALAGCSTINPDLYIIKERVGHGITRYENAEIVCYEFLGIYNFEMKCQFKKDGIQAPIPQEIWKLAQQ